MGSLHLSAYKSKSTTCEMLKPRCCVSPAAPSINGSSADRLLIASTDLGNYPRPSTSPKAIKSSGPTLVIDHRASTRRAETRNLLRSGGTRSPATRDPGNPPRPAASERYLLETGGAREGERGQGGRLPSRREGNALEALERERGERVASGSGEEEVVAWPRRRLVGACGGERGGARQASPVEERRRRL